MAIANNNNIQVRSLYGELEPKVWKVVKGRVHSTLTQGRERDIIRLYQA
ncbi:MAG: hypothetical protein RMX96_18835 [Nostoc sp. ChiSLP02]|nr:hypothetical protein [Nostoc sp. DedSLP05]MDZ8099780.1 hypothetical protein [Nostoc sp. DedSLP01]MDZ8186892.1 hypothetical protein [Nostoc sp. ChiSLP02]